MTQRQKKAARVLIGCTLALILTIVAVVMVLRLLDGRASGEEYDPEAHALNTGSSAILSETSDGGSEYMSSTVFVGDSNIVRMYDYGMLTLDQFVGKEGMGIQGVISEQCAYFENDSAAYTIPQAIAKMKPQRVVMMLGTNNAPGEVDVSSFIADYRQAVQAIQSAYSYCDIIVAAIPPVPQEHGNYSDIKMETIDEMNQALLAMCEADGYAFLNTSEELKGSDGFGRSNYFAADDIHFSTDGITAFLSYVRTHRLETEDRRPDTDRDLRAASPASGGSSPSEPQATEAPQETEPPQATPEPTPTPTATPQSFTASYAVDGSGGTLSCSKDNASGQSSLRYTVEENDSLTVTAVPAEGYSFVRWSDGVTTAERTDSAFRSDLSVTATFAQANVTIHISPNTTTVNIHEQVPMSVQVTVNGSDYSASSVIWYDNDVKVGTGSSYLFETATPDSTHSIKAEITVNGLLRYDIATIFVNPLPEENDEDEDDDD